MKQSGQEKDMLGGHRFGKRLLWKSGCALCEKYLQRHPDQRAPRISDLKSCPYGWLHFTEKGKALHKKLAPFI